MNDMVTITRAEYLMLLAAAEQVSDLNAYDRATTRIAAGDDEMIPGAFANRLLDGESPLRVYRDLRGLTQTALSDLSGVNRVQIADIEAGRKSGSVATLHKLAEALAVTVDDLIR